MTQRAVAWERNPRTELQRAVQLPYCLITVPVKSHVLLHAGAGTWPCIQMWLDDRKPVQVSCSPNGPVCCHGCPPAQVFFEQYVPLDKLVKRVAQLSGLRELLDSRDPEGIVMGYTAVVEINPAVTPAMVDKLLAHRLVGEAEFACLLPCLLAFLLAWSLLACSRALARADRAVFMVGVLLWGSPRCASGLRQSWTARAACSKDACCAVCAAGRASARCRWRRSACNARSCMLRPSSSRRRPGTTARTSCHR